MKNNKGFTLVELVAVIALLAIIMIISSVSIIKVLEDGKKNDCNNQLMSIQTAAKEYVSDNRYNNSFINGINEDNKVIEVKISDLVSDNYLTKPIVDPFDKSKNIYDNDTNKIYIKVMLNRDYTAGDVIVYNDKYEGTIVNCEKDYW